MSRRRVAGVTARRRPAAARKKLTAFLDEGSEIEGKYTFTGTVLLNGKFHGEIASQDTLIIGERGVVNATVRAGTLVVNGELVGNVTAAAGFALGAVVLEVRRADVTHRGALAKGQLTPTHTYLSSV